jgi:hypothetical protein
MGVALISAGYQALFNGLFLPGGIIQDGKGTGQERIRKADQGGTIESPVARAIKPSISW